MSELRHHGVKGMKWGVRKAEKYRARELKKVDKRYDTTKLDKRIEKGVAKYNKKPSVRRDRSLRGMAYESYRREGMKLLESDRLRKMSANELRAEHKQVGKIRTKNVLSAIGGRAMAELIGVGVYRTTDVGEFKTNSRVSMDDRVKVDVEARRGANAAVDKLTGRKVKTEPVHTANASNRDRKLTPEEQQFWVALHEQQTKRR